MNCPDCGRPMDESMDKKYEYFNCPRCGSEVRRSSQDAMDRYRLKKKYSKYTNLIIWQKLKELRRKGEEERMKKIEKMDYASDYNVAAMWMKLNEIIDVLNELTAPVTTKVEEKKTLWINENCAVVEFCCDKLEACIDHYEIGFMDNYENGTTKPILNQKIFDDAERLTQIIHHGTCPCCGAHIKLKKHAAELAKGIQISEGDVKDILEILKR